jgi:FkbM family methyltransferase
MARSIRSLTRPVRGWPLPVLRGNGRGLRLRVGESANVLNGGNEPTIEKALLDMLHEGDVFYDIGANIGWYSLLAARKTLAPVVAFEPSVRNAAILQQNAATNRLAVTTIPAAVSDVDGWATFLDRSSLEGRLDKDDCEAQAERRAKRNRPRARTHPVPVVTVDSFLAASEQQPPAVVKIDVEGAELGVLRGMVDTLAATRPRLLIELHGTQREVADFLDEHAYEHRPVESDVETRLAPWWAHVLAQPVAS